MLLKMLNSLTEGTSCLDWNHKAGRYAFGKPKNSQMMMDGAVVDCDCICPDVHKETQQDVALPMGITIRVADTHGSQEPPPCLMIKNSSSALAQISMNGTKVPLAPLFANARNGFEEIIDLSMPLDEYKILDGMVADDNFNVGQHIQTQKSLTLDKEDPWKMKQQQTSIGNTLLTTLMPSLTSSPHRLARRDIREVVAKGGVPASFGQGGSSMEATVRKSTLPEPASPVPTRISSSPTNKKEESAFTEEKP